MDRWTCSGCARTADRALDLVEFGWTVDPVVEIGFRENKAMTSRLLDRRSVSSWSGLALLPTFLLVTGCPVQLDGGPTGPVIDGNVDGTLSSPLGKTSGEPNDSFDAAVVVVFNEAETARIQGTVDRNSDLDVFRLGALVRGDRLLIETTTPASNLDVSVAVFDDQGRLVHAVDDRAPDDLDATVDLIVRHDGDPYYLVVTGSAFAARGDGTGTYSAVLTIKSGVAVPGSKPQVLLLDFDGASINSATLGRVNLPPFDAADISSIYRGETQAMKSAIREVMEQNFRGFNVTIETTDGRSAASGGEMSTIHFGGFRPDIFGIAENVDLYNVDYCDDGIIYTESFSLQVFSFTPSVEDMGLAIGNVAAHEAGHLLGLNHVDDDQDLMDAQSPADAFIADQEFMESPLSRDIMPIGTQDGVLLLAETVGLTAP